jgi:hypothetical protein
MSEDVKPTDSDEGKLSQTDLVAELGRLGENLGRLVKAAWESEERRTVEKEVRAGLDKFNQQIYRAVEQSKAEEGLRKAQDTVQDIWHTAHGPQVVREMQAGLVDSLRRLNDEIAKRSASAPAHEATDAASTLLSTDTIVDGDKPS